MVLWHGIRRSWDYRILGLGMVIWVIEEQNETRHDILKPEWKTWNCSSDWASTGYNIRTDMKYSLAVRFYKTLHQSLSMKN